MWEDLGAFLQTPNSRNYLAVRRHILALDDHLMDRQWLDGLVDVFRQQLWEQALTRVDQMNDAWVLSPAYHGYAALVLRALGRDEDAETEAFLRLRCLQGLAATGSGTPSRPYRCTYPGDAQELLSHLGETCVCQRLIPRGNRCCDVLEAQSGRSFWMEAPHTQVVREQGRFEAAPAVHKS